MTISSETSNASFIGDGSTTIFPCAFKVFDEDHVQVFVDGVQKMLGGDFTVSGVGGETFDVVFTSAPAAQAKISVVRVVPMLQEIDYLSNDAFPAETHERGLDLLTMMVQQTQAGNEGRPIKYPPGDPASLTGVLPDAAARASKLLGFDSNGEAVPVVGADLGAFSVGEVHTWTAAQTIQIGADADGWRVTDTLGNTRIKMRRRADGRAALVFGPGDHTTSMQIIEGDGAPEGVVSASVGDILVRADGGSSGRQLYIKETGVETNTGWVALGIELRVQVAATGAGVTLGDIKANARRVTLMFRDLSTTGQAELVLELGTASSFVNTTYHGGCNGVGNPDPSVDPMAPNAFRLTTAMTAAKTYSGVVELLNFGSSNIWMLSSQVASEDGVEFNNACGHAILVGPLGRVRIEPEGAEEFDDGNINMMVW